MGALITKDPGVANFGGLFTYTHIDIPTPNILTELIHFLEAISDFLQYCKDFSILLFSHSYLLFTRIMGIDH